MSSGKCQCYPGWESDACDKQMATYEAGSACDQDCSSQCLDDFLVDAKFHLITIQRYGIKTVNPQ